MLNETEKHYSFEDLVNLVIRLRAPGGCPWDREQTHQSIKKNLVEEAYEVAEAIDSGVGAKMADESGDLLLQVVFHAVMAQEAGEYTMDDVTDAICRKLIHRHPHVFGTTEVENSEEVLKNWDAIKRADRGQKSITADLKGVSAYLPALMRAEKIQKKAQKAGYPFEEPALSALPEQVQQNPGQLLFDAVSLCRSQGIEPEMALSEYLNQFIDRFEEFETGQARLDI